jgi:hypothetical protein
MCAMTALQTPPSAKGQAVPGGEQAGVATVMSTADEYVREYTRMFPEMAALAGFADADQTNFQIGRLVHCERGRQGRMPC